MGRTNFASMLALLMVLFPQSFAWAQRPDEAIRYARALLSDACKLHRLLESAGADPFTLRSACRLESSTEELIEKLQCPSRIADAETLVDDCILWYNRTSVGVRRQHCLATDRAIASTLACAGRQLTLVESAVDCLLRHGVRAPIIQPPVTQPPVWTLPHPGFAPNPVRTRQLRPTFPGQPFPGQPFPGQASPTQPVPTQPGAWVRGPFGTPVNPRSGLAPNNHPFGIEDLSNPAPVQPDFDQEGFGQPRVGQLQAQEFDYRQPTRTPVQPASQRGQIARAVLELMLSEMSR